MCGFLWRGVGGRYYEESANAMAQMFVPQVGWWVGCWVGWLVGEWAHSVERTALLTARGRWAHWMPSALLRVVSPAAHTSCVCAGPSCRVTVAASVAGRCPVAVSAPAPMTLASPCMCRRSSRRRCPQEVKPQRKLSFSEKASEQAHKTCDWCTENARNATLFAFFGIWIAAGVIFGMAYVAAACRVCCGRDG